MRRSEFLSPEDLAERYGIPVATVYQWRTKGYGPRGIKVGRHVRYPLAACEEWERRQADPTSAA